MAVRCEQLRHLAQSSVRTLATCRHVLLLGIVVPRRVGRSPLTNFCCGRLLSLRACRHVSEVPLTTQLANKGVATLLGVGYMMLHALEARTQPHTQFWQHQVQVDGFAGRPTAFATEWVPAPVESRV